ncbi:MAG TPA: SPFH domain-containing protein [Bacteroidales bacterium]|jgi:regulator of protease activity HflC (stomatin/prohibitin superfamily)|nr:SPFH domain-containing protein [Bacteroidales bacterium]
MKTEQNFQPLNGYLMSALVIIMAAGIVMAGINEIVWLVVTLTILIVFVAPGLFIVNPNSSKVLLLFGAYTGSVKNNGFFWVLPFYKRTEISLRARNFESDKIKVNDRIGNPVLISVILVWKVKDTFKAAFEVNNYEDFVKVQTDSAVRKLAGTYPYDHFEDERAEITLSSNFEQVNANLEHEISERLEMAGLEVIEARIAYLAYAPEIAQAMLRRQQATATVAARHKIVEGAVGMVESALALLSKRGIIELDEERKAAMVSNLLVVLCGDSQAEPVINTGTLHQ